MQSSSTKSFTQSAKNDLNYNWIYKIYAIGSLLALILYLLEEYGSRPKRSFVASLDGLYIVFLPYIPCLIWAVFRLQQSHQERSNSTMKVEEKQE